MKKEELKSITNALEEALSLISDERKGLHNDEELERRYDVTIRNLTKAIKIATDE